MQIQAISNNYKAQKQRNNPSFGARIVFNNNAPEIKSMGDCLEKMMGASFDGGGRTFLKIALRTFLESMRSIAKHNVKRESHVLYDTSCTIPVRKISFETGTGIWLSSSTDTTTKFTQHIVNHPKQAHMVIETASGVNVKIPVCASKEEIAKTVESIQDEAITLKERMFPTNSIKRYLGVIEGGSERQPIQNVEL